jgi:hypothetical protein
MYVELHRHVVSKMHAYILIQHHALNKHSTHIHIHIHIHIFIHTQAKWQTILIRTAHRHKRHRAISVFFHSWSRVCTRAYAVEGALRAVCTGSRSERVKNTLMPLVYALRYRSAPSAFNTVTATCFTLFGRPPARTVSTCVRCCYTCSPCVCACVCFVCMFGRPPVCTVSACVRCFHTKLTHTWGAYIP